MNTAAASGRVLLIDDHPLFHEGMASAFEHAGRGLALTGAETVADGLRRVAEEAPFDLVLIDLMLPGTDGLTALGEFGRAAPWLPRVLFSGRLDPAVIVQARQLGACAFIAKSWPVRRIVDTVHALIAGAVDFSVLDELRGQAPPAVALSERQWALLKMLAQGCNNKEMARALAIADRTVRAHLTDLFQALGAATRLQALLHAQKAGLIATWADAAPVDDDA